MRYNTDINRISNDAAVPLTLRVKSKPVWRSAMSDSTPLKRCSKCNAEYPATPEYFSRQSSTKDGLHSNCKPCKNASNRNWYDNNRDIRTEQMMEYYRQHKDAWREKSIKKYRDNPELISQLFKMWRQNNPDRAKEVDVRRTAKYRHNNPGIIRLRNQKYRSKDRRNSFGANDWQSCIEHFDYKCAACGRPAGLWHKIVPDHWIPLAKDGSNYATNIVPLCHGIDGCNNRKGDLFPDEWLNKQFNKTKAKSIKNRIEKYFALIKKVEEK